MDLRHEWKHRISRADLLTLRQRLGILMDPDPHAKNGSYFVRSLYFDSPDNKALLEKLDGVSHREKFRIRYYDLDTTVIHLEKKTKCNGLGSKDSAPLSAQEVQSILDGSFHWMAGCDRPLVRQLYQKMLQQGLRPKTIVDYTREPFIYAPGNVRVTLDYRIRTGIGVADFLKGDCVTLPAADDPILLEVKWDDYLPDIIRRAVQLGNRQAAAFSKYAACRYF